MGDWPPNEQLIPTLRHTRGRAGAQTQGNAIRLLVIERLAHALAWQRFLIAAFSISCVFATPLQSPSPPGSTICSLFLHGLCRHDWPCTRREPLLTLALVRKPRTLGSGSIGCRSSEFISPGGVKPPLHQIDPLPDSHLGWPGDSFDATICDTSQGGGGSSTSPRPRTPEGR